MAARVTVYYAAGSGRSEVVAEAMASGIRRHPRIRVRVEEVNRYQGPRSDVAVFYGLHRRILEEYRKSGRAAIYVDLGYWGRHEGGRRAGFHKMALNGRHPTSYFQRLAHGPERFRHFGVDVRPWRGGLDGGFILLAGMSAKAARAEGFAPEEWERRAVKEIRKHTDRKIMYRPKPNWSGAREIPGTTMKRGKDGDVGSWLDRCHAVVTHHSNVSIDALLHGVPVFCWDGVATAPAKASSDLSKIEDPPEAIDREQWAADIAWTQWKISEMKSGAAWAYLVDEELVLA